MPLRITDLPSELFSRIMFYCDDASLVALTDVSRGAQTFAAHEALDRYSGALQALHPRAATLYEAKTDTPLAPLKKPPLQKAYFGGMCVSTTSDKGMIAQRLGVSLGFLYGFPLLNAAVSQHTVKIGVTPSATAFYVFCMSLSTGMAYGKWGETLCPKKENPDPLFKRIAAQFRTPAHGGPRMAILGAVIGFVALHSAGAALYNRYPANGWGLVGLLLLMGAASAPQAGIYFGLAMDASRKSKSVAGDVQDFRNLMLLVDHMHAMNDHEDTCRDVLKVQELGLSIDVPDAEGATVLDKAIQANNSDHAGRLVERGATLHAKALEGASPETLTSVSRALLRRAEG